MSAQPEVSEFQLKPTFLQVVKNSVGTQMFKHCYYHFNGGTQEVLRNGDLSCAFFVSAVLRMFGLISDLHVNVGLTVEDMLKSGWEETSRPERGCVIVYREKQCQLGEYHRHMGFFIGDCEVVHNDSRTGTPQISHWHHRPIERVLMHPELR